jgi:uncharacterized protein YbcC (UPF0753/DUF2309 family)
MVSTSQRPPVLSAEEREELRNQVLDACTPVAQLWPLKTFAYRNPTRGFEHLSFDQAVREAKRLLGGNGYLSNQEYRQFYREGRITEKGVRRALAEVGPNAGTQSEVRVGARSVAAPEVLWLHLLFGIDALEPPLLRWTMQAGGGTKRFRADLPDDSKRRILERSGEQGESLGRNAEERIAANLWSSALSALGLSESFSDDLKEHQDVEFAAPPQAELPAQRSLSDWLESLTGESLVDPINQQMMKWTAAFLDEGLAGWSMPSKGRGFYSCWRELAPRDASGRLLGIRNFPRKADALPELPEEAIAYCLTRLEIPTSRWKEYQSRQLAQLPGWTGFIRWLGENPEYPAQRERPIDVVQYLAVRLFYEVEIVDAWCRRAWGIAGTLSEILSYLQEHPIENGSSREPHGADPHTLAACRGGWRLFQLAQFLELTPGEIRSLSLADVQTLLGWLDSFPADRHAPVWIEAYEDAYQAQLIEILSSRPDSNREADGRPRAQFIFCIDARSEPFRRRIESRGPYETLGFAGFFGVPISYQAFDSAERFALCPVLFKPAFAVDEIPWPGQQQPLESYASGTRWSWLGDDLFHDLKKNPIGSFMMVDALGLLFSAGLFGKTLALKLYRRLQDWIGRWLAASVETQIPIDKSEPAANGSGPEEPQASPAPQPLGFTLEQQAAFVENGLRLIGLTKNFGRFVVVCGHGSAVDNNPYAAAYNCGACGGSHGDPNARVFAAMANRPEVRRLLKENGFVIPEDTWFVAGKHNTATDRVAFYDLAGLPPSHAEDFRFLTSDLETAGADQARERCGRLPRAPRAMSPQKAYRHVLERTMDWANVRPEWGLSSNAAFLIGRRQVTAGLDLGARVFLHSYDPEADADGGLLEKIMMAPLIVGQWINLEYYFSAVDPWVYGSGSKVFHNVVSGVGVMIGSQSDLQSGLPLQSVNDGAVHYHEPMRLLAVIEAPVDRISFLVQKHEILQQLFYNRWVNLLAIDPATSKLRRYKGDFTWEAATQARAA